jgi:hypothetical protein
VRTPRLIARFALPTAVAGLTLALAGEGGAAQKADTNPCKGPKSEVLLCPNLQMDSPRDLFIDEYEGKKVLHSTNSINSRGEGPAELRGRPHGDFSMTANQGIHGTDGKTRIYDTGAWLGWKSIPGQGHYWKFRDAARFEIWSLDGEGLPKKRVRTGPKQYYCLRDLFHTKPGKRSPESAVYPACSQVHDLDRVKLGTSVGWSDVYPSTYHEQFINIEGLHGTYGFFLIADPKNGIWENHEHDNAGWVKIKLPSGHVLEKGSKIDRPSEGKL